MKNIKLAKFYLKPFLNLKAKINLRKLHNEIQIFLTYKKISVLNNRGSIH